MEINNWPVTFLTEYMSPLVQIVLVWIIMAIILRLGKFGAIFRVYNTFFHEIGHALMSLCFSGSVNRIELFSNAGGVALTANKSWLARFMVSVAGYPFAAAMSWFLLTKLHLIPKNYLVVGMLAIYALALILWVRNKYGLGWILANIILLAAAIFYKFEAYAGIYFFVIGSFTMIESIYSSFVLIYVSAENPHEAGDAKNLRDLTYIPAVFWALALGFVSLFFLNLTLKTVINWSVI